MKKIISLLLFCTLACGCSVQYDLTIDEQSAKESVTAFVPYTESTKQNIDIYATQKIPSIANGQSDTFYATTATLDDNNYVLNYTYNHSLNSISNSYFIANCYRGTTVSQDENSIIIKGGNQMTCINGDDGLNSTEIAVNITTQLKVIENNADKINNNTYTWIFNKNNYNNKVINLKLQKNATIEQTVKSTIANTEESFQISNYKEIFVIAIGLIIIVPIVYFVIKKKHNRINKF